MGTPVRHALSLSARSPTISRPPLASLAMLTRQQQSVNNTPGFGNKRAITSCNHVATLCETQSVILFRLKIITQCKHNDYH